MQNTFIHVIGHKNPDTDSICSAIAYAELKNRTSSKNYIAMRAGHINEETQYILNRFNVRRPRYLGSVNPQVKDIKIRMIEGVSGSISLKKAWAIMNENNVVTLPITASNKLEGLITISDIAKSYMDVYDSSIIGRARTQYSNILETIDGTMITGNEHSYVVKGKVLIAAANPELMENYIEEDDMVILGNRYESQLCAIEMKASSIIVCEGASISMTIKKIAEENDCAIISTPHDTYTVARLINQSMPIKHFMKKENLITFRTDEEVETIKAVMAKKRNRDFPIINEDGDYVGMVSRRNLLNLKRKQIILVDHNERTQAVDGIENADILEIIDHHRIGTIETLEPVFFRNQPLGCTATIIYQMYMEQNVEIGPTIAGLLCGAIISDTLMFRSPTCTSVDRKAASELAHIANLDIDEFAKDMFTAGSNLANKKAKSIFYQDFKNFSVGDISMGVGQINCMTDEDLAIIKKKLNDYISTDFASHNADMIFFMITNIIEENTTLLCFGNGSEQLVEEAFHVIPKNHECLLNGVVSRKKQLIPTLVGTIQN